MCVAAPQAGQQVPSVYVPQMGDQVVYLRTGHQRFLESHNDKRPPPWEALTVSAAQPPRLRVLPMTCQGPILNGRVVAFKLQSPRLSPQIFCLKTDCEFLDASGSNPLSAPCQS